MTLILNIAYFIAAILFIVGLKQMSSPRTARIGIIAAGWGMLIAVVVTFFAIESPSLTNFILIITALFLGTAFAWVSGKKVAMTNMPQMIAIYNGMGGGAASCIAAIKLLHGTDASIVINALALTGAILGTVSFSGSIIAYAKLEGLLNRTIYLPGHHIINIGLFVITLGLSILLLFNPSSGLLLTLFFSTLLLLGILMTVPVGGANMPIVISLFNAMTGLAVAMEGFVLDNAAMIIAGTVVGAAGSLLTHLMAKAMNQPIHSILFTPYAGNQTSATDAEQKTSKSIEASDAAVMLSYAKNVIIIPGYGMAVAQAQNKIWELTQLLEANGVNVRFAIHPVAGRMPGHMNVLLAEAGVPYDKIFDLEDINADFKNTDAVVVIGANDVVNPAARNNPNSPIYGMPILDADYAQNVIVVKRGQGKGFSGIENDLFFLENTQMLYGDANQVAGELIQAIKEM